MKLWRQGDVLIAETRPVPQQNPRPDLVLARGELTGHSHRIAERGAAVVYPSTLPLELYLEITADRATVVHDEHDPIVLERGWYRVWRQREYTPTAIRPVYD